MEFKGAASRRDGRGKGTGKGENGMDKMGRDGFEEDRSTGGMGREEMKVLPAHF